MSVRFSCKSCADEATCPGFCSLVCAVVTVEGESISVPDVEGVVPDVVSVEAGVTLSFFHTVVSCVLDDVDCIDH